MDSTCCFSCPASAEGMETHAVSLVKALAALDHENHYHVFLNREAAALGWNFGENFSIETARLSASNRPLRYLWEQTVLPVQARRVGLDVLHSVGYVGPLAVSCPSVVTIPDLNFVELRRTMNWQRRFLFFRPGMRALAYRSSKRRRRARRSLVLLLARCPKWQARARCFSIPARWTIWHAQSASASPM